ncbi:MAG: hypothetical protein V4563_17135 [Pseudomonadota bacterium]
MANIAAISQLTAEKGIEALKADTDPLLKVVDKTYSKTFADKTYQSGATVRIRVEDQPAPPQNQTAFSNDPILQTERTITASNWTTGLEVGAQFENLDIGGEDLLENRVNKARMSRMATQIAQIGYDSLRYGQRTVTSVPAGTALKTASDFGNYQAAMADMMANDDLYVAMQPADMAGIAGDLATRFNPTQDSATAYLRGVVKESMNMNFYSTTLIPFHTNGSAAGTGTAGMYLSVNVASGDTSITVAGNTVASGTITKGTIIYFPGNGIDTGANEVNPVTQQQNGNGAAFTVAADVTLSSGAGVITLTQAIYGPEQPKLQNVSRLPTVSGTAAYVQIYGTPSHTYRQMFFFRKESSLAMVGLKSAELIRADNGIAYYDGMPLQTRASSDVLNLVNIMRVDFLGGAAIKQYRHCMRAFTKDMG